MHCTLQTATCAGAQRLPAWRFAVGNALQGGMAAVALALAFAAGEAAAGQPEPGLGGGGEAAVHASVVGTALDWLAAELGLPEVPEPPRIVFAAPGRIVALYLGDAAHHAGSAGAEPEVVAIYNDVERTIYLPHGWTGATPVEMSVLIHELVHHVQNVAEIGFPCPAAREKPAFAAQAAWLEQHGSDLETAFGLDPMTLLVRTNCLY